MKFNKFALALIILATSIACRRSSTPEIFTSIDVLKDYSREFLFLDTLIIDSSPTSMRGEWLINKERLFFVDYSVVGVREYDENGQFLSHHINQGRGPGESPSPFNSACFDENGNFYFTDSNWRFCKFDASFSKKLAEYRFLSEGGYDMKDWNKLLLHPDPEVNEMYEFNLDSRSMALAGDKLLVPVYTEHVTFNAYTRFNHKRFWRESYNFMLIDIEKGRITEKFGHFPAIYQRKRIPSFCSYSTDVSGDKIYTSYAADSLIYVRDISGKPLYSFGTNVPGINDDYPTNKSYNDFAETKDKYRDESGYYTSIKSEGDYLFRSYKLPGENSYGIQIYNGNSYIGYINSTEPIRVIGQIDGTYYVSAGIDIERDVFMIFRFRI